MGKLDPQEAARQAEQLRREAERQAAEAQAARDLEAQKQAEAAAKLAKSVREQVHKKN